MSRLSDEHASLQSHIFELELERRELEEQLKETNLRIRKARDRMREIEDILEGRVQLNMFDEE